MRDEPNASYYSARYAERKLARQRARDEAMGPQPCLRCSERQAPGSLFCAKHGALYAAMIAGLQDGSATPDECAEFAQRTYWP